MAPRAGKVAAVIQWFVRQAGVTVIGRHPRNCVVAQTAFLGRIEVTRVLACSRRAVVTRGTGSQYLRVIDRQYWRPYRWAVAVRADVRCLWVLCALAGCISTVMAAHAVAGDVRMVEIRRQPGDRRMTVIAVIAARNMRRVFAGCDDTVVTGSAGAEDLGVVDGRHR